MAKSVEMLLAAKEHRVSKRGEVTVADHSRGGNGPRESALPVWSRSSWAMGG